MFKRCNMKMQGLAEMKRELKKKKVAILKKIDCRELALKNNCNTAF